MSKWQIAIGLLLFITLWSLTVFQSAFNHFEDEMVYMPTATKLAQQNTLGEDPFLFARVIVNYSGHTILRALAFLYLPPNSFKLIEIFIPTLLTFLMLLSTHQKKSHFFCLILALCTINPWIVNLCPGISAMALLVAVFHRAFIEERHEQKLDLFVLSLCLTTAASFKATVWIACAFLFILIMSQLSLKRMVWLSGCCSLLIFPWALELYLSTGTWLYPLLGTGQSHVDMAQERGLINTYHFKEGLPSLIPILGLTVLLAIGTSFKRKALLILGAWVTITAGVYLFQQWRYSMVNINLIFLILLITLLKNASPKIYLKIPIFLIIIVHFIVSGFMSPFNPYTFNKGFLRGAKYQGHIWEIEKNKIRSIQKTIQEGITLVAFIQYPRFLDYSRNQVLLMDYPYTSSFLQEKHQSRLEALLKSFIEKGATHMIYSPVLPNRFKRYFSESTETSNFLSMPILLKKDLDVSGILTKSFTREIDNYYVIDLNRTLNSIKSSKESELNTLPMDLL